MTAMQVVKFSHGRAINKILSSLVLVAGLGFGCDLGRADNLAHGTSSFPTTAVATAPAPTTAPLELARLEILSYPKQVPAGEPVRIKLRVVNLVKKDIVCGFSSDVLPGIRLTGTSPDEDPISMTQYVRAEARAAALNYTHTVHPGNCFDIPILLSRDIDMTVQGKYSLEFAARVFTFNGEWFTTPVQKIAIEVTDETK